MVDLPKIRLLIIDDSKFNRETIAGFFKDNPHVEVVGTAADGQQGLHLAVTTRPSVITVDLEMPRLDGFSFIRLMMANHPVPVIVISAHAERDTVFRAMELGALDFVAKPSDRITSDISDIRADVVRKVLAAAHYNREGLRSLSTEAPQTGLHHVPFAGASPEPAEVPNARRLVVIGASTGGPASLTRILRSLPRTLDAGIVIAQHMPPRFTTTFAERLNKLSQMTVTELAVTDVIRKGHVYIAAGDADAEVHRGATGFLVKKSRPDGTERYTPSVDRLFSSAARAAGEKLLAVVLTGMGDDGAQGCRVVHEQGGRVLVESEETAVVFGMPRSVIETGIPLQQRPLHMIADHISLFGR